MSDLIRRSDAVSAMMRLQADDDDLYGVHIAEGFDGGRAVRALNKLPAVDAVEVVRCRECRRWHTKNCAMGDFPMYTDADDFCLSTTSHGHLWMRKERRTVAEREGLDA